MQVNRGWRTLICTHPTDLILQNHTDNEIWILRGSLNGISAFSVLRYLADEKCIEIDLQEQLMGNHLVQVSQSFM